MGTATVVPVTTQNGYSYSSTCDSKMGTVTVVTVTQNGYTYSSACDSKMGTVIVVIVTPKWVQLQ